MFTKKLNKSDIPYVIEDEKIELGDAADKVRAGEAHLCHDNVKVESLEIWTGLKKTGEQILSYETSISPKTPWNLFIRVFAPEKYHEVYVTYESHGDQVEAKDINVIQNSVSDILSKLTLHQNDLNCHIKDKEINGGSFV